MPGEIEAVTEFRLELERWEQRRGSSSSLSPSNHSPIPSNGDPHVAASLLKLWYRELEEPLIPKTHYKQALQHYNNPDKLLAVCKYIGIGWREKIGCDIECDRNERTKMYQRNNDDNLSKGLEIG